MSTNYTTRLLIEEGKLFEGIKEIVKEISQVLLLICRKKNEWYREIKMTAVSLVSQPNFATTLAASGPGKSATSKVLDPKNNTHGIPKTQSSKNAMVASFYGHSQIEFSVNSHSPSGDRVELSFKGEIHTQLTVKGKQDQGINDKLLAWMEKISREAMESFHRASGKFMEYLEGTEKTQTPQTQPIDEYWNAENTSERIVSFALSFFDSSQMEAEEYYSVIKKAIAKGFKLAEDMLTHTGDQARDLRESTRELTFQKLDIWLENKLQTQNEQNLVS